MSMSSSNVSTSSLNFNNSSQDTIENYYQVIPCPYVGWRQYLPETIYSDNCEEVPLIRAATKYIQTLSIVNKKVLEEKRFFYINVENLLKDENLKVAWPHLGEALEERAEHVCGVFGLAMHHILSPATDPASQASTSSETSETFPIVRARLENCNNLIQLKNLKSSYFQRLVCVQGTVVKVSPMTVHNTWLAWQCAQCKAELVVHQPEGKFKAPTKCSKGCRNQRNFVPLRSSKSTLCVDRQMLRIQEIDDEDRGRVPRTVDCELMEDLCDTCQPGDVVRITGVVKVTAGDESAKFNKKQSQYLLYISALGVSNSRSQGSSRMSGTAGIQFTYNDYALIQDVHSYGGQTFKLLVNSLCPAIFGQSLVKAGLILGLFGGTVKGSHTCLPVRGDPHILIVGDPGLGKSQMLTAACNVAPRGVFVTGNTTSASGLTVSMSRDSGNDFSLEAGALVLADQGCCCIDEFDKMSGQHAALLEAMEQQMISVCKAGVVCSMPARTAVLAAANPVGGHYNRAKTVSENLKLGPALLSRFDLVFILIDKPDDVQDSLLSEHVMSFHTRAGAGAGPGQAGANLNRESLARVRPNVGDQGSKTLVERLSPEPGEVVDPLPPPCLKKYIAYARRYVHPKLSKPAAKVLQTFYLELRSQHQTQDCVPITTRQLESMVRLTEARAKLELREEVTEQDALDVVEMMKSCMVDTFSDNIGVLDFSRSQMGSGMSSRGAAKKFVQVLQRQAEVQQKNMFTVDEMKSLATAAKIAVSGSFADFITSLNNQGFLIKKSPKLYQLLSADY